MARIDPGYVPPQQSSLGSDSGAGTPAARFFWLMAELEKVLPDRDPTSALLQESRYVGYVAEAVRLLEGARFHFTGQGRYIDKQELLDGIYALIGPYTKKTVTITPKHPPVTFKLAMCSCGKKTKFECPGDFEQGCDLGANPDHAVRVPVRVAGAVDQSLFVYVKINGDGASVGLQKILTPEQYDGLTPYGQTLYRKFYLGRKG